MRDPYEVLGISRNASEQEVKDAYRRLARQYHPDNYIDSPLADSANKKMQEINEAYDTIISGNTGGYSYSDSGNTGANSYSDSGYSRSNNGNTLRQVEELIGRGRLEDAEAVLEGMPNSQRNARWYYLKGQINYKRGWTEQAYTYFTTAHNMEPGNSEYTHAYENLYSQRNGGYRTTTRRHNSSGTGCGCGNADGCDICTGLLCADCCCECMGGDLIPCC